MADVQPRPSATRGRTSTRGGRGSQRNGPRQSHKQANGDQADASSQDFNTDLGELGDLKQQYSSQLSTLKELFPDWTDVDLLLGLQDCDGDLQRTIERISEGMLCSRQPLYVIVSSWNSNVHFGKEATNLYQEMCHSLQTSKRRQRTVPALK